MRIFEDRPNAAGLMELARLLMLAEKGANIDALVKRLNVSDRVASVVKGGLGMYGQLRHKAAVSAATTSDATWAGPLLDLHILSSGFVESLRSLSLYDAMLSSMRRVPPRQRANVVTGGFTGYSVAEAAMKPLSKLSITGDDMDARKAVAMCVVDNDLLRFGTTGTLQLFNDELRSAVAQTTDSVILPVLLSGVTLAASSGDPDADLQAAFEAIPSTANSKPVIGMAPQILKQLVFMGTNSGRRYPDLTYNGGSIAGIPVVAVDALHNYLGTDGDVIVVADASQLAGDSAIVTLDTATAGSLQMNDAPSAGPQNTTSLFQTDSSAIKAERIFSFARLRSTAAAAVKNVSYSIGSP